MVYLERATIESLADRMLPRSKKLFSEWEPLWFSKGKAEGKAEALLRFLAGRKLAVSNADRRRILECTDVATLDHWIDRVLTIPATADLFGA